MVLLLMDTVNYIHLNILFFFFKLKISFRCINSVSCEMEPMVSNLDNYVHALTLFIFQYQMTTFHMIIRLSNTRS